MILACLTNLPLMDESLFVSPMSSHANYFFLCLLCFDAALGGAQPFFLLSLLLALCGPHITIITTGGLMLSVVPCRYMDRLMDVAMIVYLCHICAAIANSYEYPDALK